MYKSKGEIWSLRKGNNIKQTEKSVPFAALDPINKELERLENLGVIFQVDYSAWASPTIYAKKKNKTIHICADFSAGFNGSLQNYNYPLPIPEVFAELNSGNFFLNWTCRMQTHKYW